jgi:hypothetical protein
MPGPDRRDPVSSAGCFAYLESEVPPGLTLSAWREQRAGSTAKRGPLSNGASSRAGAGADLAPQDRTCGCAKGARRPRSGRGPVPRRSR